VFDPAAAGPSKLMASSPAPASAVTNLPAPLTRFVGREIELAEATALLAEGRPLDRQEIREALSGNYCRCTGYHAIVAAVRRAAEARARA